jgi:AcrR family transcriptional regulator
LEVDLGEAGRTDNFVVYLFRKPRELVCAAGSAERRHDDEMSVGFAILQRVHNGSGGVRPNRARTLGCRCGDHADHDVGLANCGSHRCWIGGIAGQNGAGSCRDSTGVSGQNGDVVRGFKDRKENFAGGTARSDKGDIHVISWYVVVDNINIHTDVGDVNIKVEEELMIDKKPYHHGSLRNALVDAGLTLLSEGGIDAVSVRAAARVVGVSHGAPIRHFPDGGSFLCTLATVGYQRLGAALIEAAGSTENSLLAFRAVGLSYVNFAIENPNLFRVLSHPLLVDKSRYPELLAASLAAFAELETALQRTQHDKFVCTGDTRILALGAWSCVHGIATLIVDDQLRSKGYNQDPTEIAELVTTVLFQGLRPDH